MKKLLYKLYRRLHYMNQQSNWLHYFIQAKFGNNPLTFIQVGANDGKTADPIHSYIKSNKWKGVLIEPHPYFFKELKATYGAQSGLVFIEAAIVGTPRQSINLFVASEDLKDWKSLVSTTDSSRGDIKWLKNAGQIKEVEVKALTFGQLLEQTNINKVDVLQIDVEGLELELISNFPFNTLKPTLIHFEHKHLTFAEMAELERKLEKQGYSIYTEKYDTLCCLND